MKAPGFGFVGVGRVTGLCQPGSELKVQTDQGEIPIADVLTSKQLPNFADPEKGEYFVQISWLQTRPIQDAIQEVGMFGNQLTVCEPTTPKWRSTVERLKKWFPEYDKKYL